MIVSKELKELLDDDDSYLQKKWASMTPEEREKWDDWENVSNEDAEKVVQIIRQLATENKDNMEK